MIVQFGARSCADCSDIWDALRSAAVSVSRDNYSKAQGLDTTWFLPQWTPTTRCTRFGWFAYGAVNLELNKPTCQTITNEYLILQMFFSVNERQEVRGMQ